ncbi:hypothetical protein CSKR_102430 [Clonorchis sinensis]|uniref:Uncharacterized protein n=1 Tax=Clonorchis sinensis TaxID=79923 RepID=A0A3R7DNB9_CLOSI|nr:hypothetical protein CSKR_102430 [Clonorchis sinensis]
MCAIHGCTWARILSGRPHLDRRTIRVINQSLWLKSLTARQRCLAGNTNALLFLRNNSPPVPTPNLEDQETVFVRPLAIDQLGMRDSVSVAGTLPSIAQWVTEVRKPPHHGKVQSLRDGIVYFYAKHVDDTFRLDDSFFFCVFREAYTNTLPTSGLQHENHFTCQFSLDGRFSSSRRLREIHSFANQFGFCERLTWNPAESPVCDVFRQLNIRLTETRGLRLPDESQEGQNRSYLELSRILADHPSFPSATRHTFSLLWNIGSSGALIDCWSVRRAWQLDCKRFINSRGEHHHHSTPH